MITLTQDEIDALNAKYCQLKSSVVKRDAQLAAQGDVIQAATDIDNAENKVFDLYDQDIIKAYEDEREQLDGTYLDTPVTIPELDDLGALNTANRLYPPVGITEPVRISQFDGTPLLTTDNEIAGVASDPLSPVVIDHEDYRILKQAEREDWLVNGFGGTSPTITPTTFIVGAINAATTQIVIETTVDTENPVFAVGDTFVAIQGGNQVGVLITNIVSQIPGDPLAGSCSGEDNPPQLTEAACLLDNGVWTAAPTTYQGTFDIVVLTSGTIGASGTIDETWAGFSNADRTALVDSTDGYTVMMLAMRTDLETQIDSRITKLGVQKTSLQANQDSLLDPSAETNVDTAIAVMNAWKVSKLITDAEFTTLASERATRGPQITARIIAIGLAKAVYYDARYTSAINKGDTSRGTARIKIFREAVGSPTGTIASLKAQEEDQIQSIEDTLTLAGEPIPTC